MTRRLLSVLIVLVTLLVTGLAASWLSGCATSELVRDSIPLPAYVVESSQPEIERACGKGRYGCAYRDYVAGVCTILVEPKTPEWQMAHELAHCAGYSHRS